MEAHRAYLTYSSRWLSFISGKSRQELKQLATPQSQSRGGKENASMQPDCLMEPGFFTQTKAETVTHPGRQLTRKLNGWEAHSVLETQPAVFSHLVSPNPISVIWAVTALYLGDTRWSVILSWNLSTWKVKGERVWGQLGLYSEILFQKQVNNLTSQ